MKILITVIRIIVGLLFIFSGLVKANDPLGLSYKMQEFFEVWGIHGLNSFTLPMAVLTNAFEIIAGVALLIGWRIKLFGWLLLLLIVFFTFLTGYTYFTGQPKNCGCFGDCLPISSKTSFLKDIVLLVLILAIVWKKNLVKPLFPKWPGLLVMLLATVFSFALQWYALRYLPVVDCLPFKKGNNIPEKMKMPANAIPDSTVITFVYEKGGKEIEFTADKFPDDFNGTDYKLVRRYDRVVRTGSNNVPPIQGFSLTGQTNTDSTGYVLDQPYALLLFAENFSTLSGWKNDFEEIYTAAKQKNIPAFIITSQPDEAAQVAIGTAFADIQVFKCDYKTILTAARVNSTLYLLQQGTVIGKESYKCIGGIKKKVAALPAQEAPIVLPEPVLTDSTASTEP